VGGVELTDQPVERKGCFPDLEEQSAARTTAANAAHAVNGRIVTFVLATTAVKLAGADFHWRTGRPGCLSRSHEGPQTTRTLRRAQLAQSLRFNLPDALARDVELLTDLF
jgi:hypothetical protein